MQNYDEIHSVICVFTSFILHFPTFSIFFIKNGHESGVNPEAMSVALRRVGKMDIHLGEGEAQSELRKSIVDFLVYVLETPPVVGRFHPCAHCQVHA